jgi:staphyloferrin B biosynthesis citrate synthase
MPATSIGGFRKSRLKRLVRDHKSALGTGLSIPSLQIVDAVGQAGLDFVIIDTEHLGFTAYDTAGIENIVRAAELYDMTALVRVLDNDYDAIAHALDAGAQGLIVPHIRTKQDARRVADAALFPPGGKRGAGHQRGTYRMVEDLTVLLEQANQEMFLIGIIEEKEGYENLAEILSEGALDAVILGPGDLALDIGVAFTHPKVAEYIENGKNVCRSKQIPWLDNASDPGKAAELGSNGAPLIGFGVDSAVIFNVYSSLAKAARPTPS